MSPRSSAGLPRRCVNRRVSGPRPGGPAHQELPSTTAASGRTARPTVRPRENPAAEPMRWNCARASPAKLAAQTHSPRRNRTPPLRESRHCPTSPAATRATTARLREGRLRKLQKSKTSGARDVECHGWETKRRRIVSSISRSRQRLRHCRTEFTSPSTPPPEPAVRRYRVHSRSRACRTARSSFQHRASPPLKCQTRTADSGR